MMLNHQPRLLCPACRSPFRLDELRQLVGMPHTVDDWFDRLAKAKHGDHADILAPPKGGSKKTLKKKSSTAEDTSVPLSRRSTADIRNSIDNAIKDWQELCSLGGEGEPTEHAPFSYPRVVQSVELKSRKPSIKLLASPRKRQRHQKKETSRITKIARPRREAASAAATQMTKALAEQEDVEMSDFESELETEASNDSSSNECDDGDDETENETTTARYAKYILVSV